MIGLIVDVGKFFLKEVSDWSKRRDTLKTVQLEAEVAEIRAKAEIAAYKVKADIEWDLAWAGQAQSSWKDEFILILWTVPIVAFIPSLFFEGSREGVMETLVFIKDTFGSDLIEFYLMGWAAIFAATFGMKSLTQAMVPGKVTKMVEALSSVPDDIPDAVAKQAQTRVSGFMDKVREGLF